ncbi:hypothetical protein KC19_11G161400 [Ceratodon purpureus]|uniref:Pectinesterase n=1 Tax=Ceratodon purpureus TaxID=3225 RepID=A0A8T0GJE9_CERPU|nr:hypothetical protein KC19_11G161400 [Ceratodon purpureus]
MAVSRVLEVLVMILVVVPLAYGQSSESEYDAWLAANQAKYQDSVTALGTPPAVGDFVTVAADSPPASPSCIRYVGKKGSGAKYSKVKSAVKSIPDGMTERCVIYVGEGVWEEKFEIPKTKGPITLKGVSALKSVIQYGDYAEKAGSTSKSATVAVMSDYFKAEDITFSNTHPPPPGGAVGQQAVAFRIEGDKAEFYRVAFLGGQDTLYDKKGRHYYKDCYIKGSIDFIFGAGNAFFERCNLASIANPGSGSLTAQKKTSKNEMSGFVFYGCLVTGNGPIYLGRAWGTYSKVVFVYTDIQAPIYPEGWFNWGDPKREKTVYYGQYKCYGPGADTSGRVSWSKDLSDEQAKPFLSNDFVDASSWIGKK